MTDEEWDKIQTMLLSPDVEMQNLGITSFGELVRDWPDYESRRVGKFFNISDSLRKRMRRIMINSHGKIRKRYKKY